MTTVVIHELDEDDRWHSPDSTLQTFISVDRDRQRTHVISSSFHQLIMQTYFIYCKVFSSHSRVYAGQL